MNPTIFTELSVILLIAFIVTGIVKLFRQPSIIGYILSGIIAGPFVLNIIGSHDTLATFSQIGIALLLFLVGLNLNPKVIKDVGKVAIITGLGQVLFTTLVGYFISKGFGFSHVISLYIAVALTFSSTIVIMKLLSDKRDLESVYGRISVGFLIVQDFIAIAILFFISTMSADINFTSTMPQIILKVLGGFLVLFLLTKYLLPKLTNIIAKSQEFLLLFSLTWCFVVAASFHYLNFSIEAGALLAGITLSMSPYHFEISSRMKSLRDFFLILFFIVLGSEMVFYNVVSNIPIILILSAFVLIGNPLIVMTIMGLLGYTKRNSFLCGLTVAQISEFSLILVTLGVSTGHLTTEILSIVTKVALITFAGSTYMIIYSDKIYPKISRYLSIFERKENKVDEHKYHSHNNHDIIMFGYNRIGFDVLKSLKRIRKKFLIIDYNPEVITKLSKQDFDCRYGDADDLELLDELNMSRARMVISTIPIIDTNIQIIKKAREANPKSIIAVVSHHIEEAERLYEEGATYVIMPHFLGGEHFSTMIEKNKLSINKFLEEKISHIEHLKQRKIIGHKHPTHH